MFDKLKQFRKKPYGERKRATITISLSLTLIVAFVWGTVFFPRILTRHDGAEMLAESVSPFRTLSEDLSIIWGDFQGGVGAFGEVFTEILVPPEENAPAPAPSVLDIGARGEIPEETVEGEIAPETEASADQESLAAPAAEAGVGEGQEPATSPTPPLRQNQMRE